MDDGAGLSRWQADRAFTAVGVGTAFLPSSARGACGWWLYPAVAPLRARDVDGVEVTLGLAPQLAGGKTHRFAGGGASVCRGVGRNQNEVSGRVDVARRVEVGGCGAGGSVRRRLILIEGAGLGEAAAGRGVIAEREGCAKGTEAAFGEDIGGGDLDRGSRRAGRAVHRDVIGKRVGRLDNLGPEVDLEGLIERAAEYLHRGSTGCGALRGVEAGELRGGGTLVEPDARRGSRVAGAEEHVAVLRRGGAGIAGGLQEAEVVVASEPHGDLRGGVELHGVEDAGGVRSAAEDIELGRGPAGGGAHSVIAGDGVGGATGGQGGDDAAVGKRLTGERGPLHFCEVGGRGGGQGGEGGVVAAV